jgi:large subunit ribosomal protein L10
MPSQKKIDQVKDLTEKLGKAKAFFLADYRGLTHQQLESLRKALRKVEGEFVIAKNTLFKLSLKNNLSAGKAGAIMDNDAMLQFEKELNNPNATLFAFGDEIAPLKVLSDFIKNHQLPKVKIGIFGGKVATAEQFGQLASLPTREVLLATLALRLKSPIYGLHYAMRWNLQGLVIALDQVKKKKPAN